MTISTKKCFCYLHCLLYRFINETKTKRRLQRLSPVWLSFSWYLGVDQRREADNDRVDPEHGDVLLDAAVSDDVLVPEGLCKRRQPVYSDCHSHQHAHAAQCNHDAVWNDAQRGNAIFRQPR